MKSLGVINASISAGSPPSRAAWIEMQKASAKAEATVASPPSRAAWIEMSAVSVNPSSSIVAAFTGGVD